MANSAALGAALRAAHADLNASASNTGWDEVIRGFVEPVPESRLVPDTRRHALYQELIHVHAACEAHALGRGPDPGPLLSRFSERMI
jgi:hypothetical protein